VINILLEPLGYVFMQRGLLAAIIVGILCSVIGCYVVLRSMAFLGDAIAHAILPGVAVAYLLQINLTIGALATAVLVAVAISFFSHEGTLREDTAIGIIFTAALALGVALISSIQSYAVDLTHIMFGNILGVSGADVIIAGAVAFVVLSVVVIFYRPFLIVSFDPILGTTLKLPVQALRSLILILLAFSIVVSIQAVGVALSAAMLVTPAATAYLLTRRLPGMMIVSAGIGAVCSIAGLYFSYYFNVASGSAIVLFATLFFLLAFFFAPGKGLVSRSFQRRLTRKA
jgi:manganese/iron transport system permease protein